MLSGLRVAIVHDWLVTYGGAERVLEQMLILFPNADLFSIVDFLPDQDRKHLRGRSVTTSFVQRLPMARSKYRNYLPVMPFAIERFDLSSYELVISSSHAVAKGVITGPDQLHICMCYSPMRYAWDLTHQYLRESGLSDGPRGVLAQRMLHRMRSWDVISANRVDEFIAISHYIARRILKTYRRKSSVIYPPVDVNAYDLCQKKEDFYLTVSRMVPYKRIDLIVESFQLMPDKKLIVIGDGPDFAKIRSKAGANVTLLGYQPFEVVKDHLQRTRGFLFAAEEDFGIVLIEAQACGTPVIAYGKGAALETIINGKTGLLFEQQQTAEIVDAVRKFEQMQDHFDPIEIRKNALRFSQDRFRNELTEFVTSSLASYPEALSPNAG